MKYQIEIKDCVIELNSQDIMNYMTYKLSNSYYVATQKLELIKDIFQHEKLAYKEITFDEFKEVIENKIYEYHHIDLY